MVNSPKYHIGSYVVEENNKSIFFTRCNSLNSSSVQCAVFSAEIGEDSKLLNIHKLNEEVNQPGFTNTQPCISALDIWMAWIDPSRHPIMIPIRGQLNELRKL